MNKESLSKLSKSELIELLLKKISQFLLPEFTKPLQSHARVLKNWFNNMKRILCNHQLNLGMTISQYQLQEIKSSCSCSKN